MADADVQAGDDADEHGDGDVDVGQVGGAVAIEEQRIARRLAGDAAGHGQKEVAEEGEGPPQFLAREAERTFSKTQHRRRFEFTLG